MNLVDVPAALLPGELTHRFEIFPPKLAAHHKYRKRLAGQQLSCFI